MYYVFLTERRLTTADTDFELSTFTEFRLPAEDTDFEV